METRKASRRITRHFSGLDRKEWLLLKKLSTPAKVQDYINSLPFDFRPGYKIDRSVRGILKSGKADCAGGAVIAAAALWAQGRRPLLLDLRAPKPDFDHVVAVFKDVRRFGAISKSNHAVLRYREPVYMNVRELIMSYFHEYFLTDGRKTLRAYSKPLDLSLSGFKWLTDKDAVADIIHRLDNSKHFPVFNARKMKRLRPADPIEIKSIQLQEYKGHL